MRFLVTVTGNWPPGIRKTLGIPTFERLTRDHRPERGPGARKDKDA